MTIEDAKIIIKKHPLIHGESVNPIRKQIVHSIMKLIAKQERTENCKKIIKGIISTRGIICTGVYSAALNYLQSIDIKEI